MIIGVLGDTHGDLRPVQKCLNMMKDVDLILHTGDFYEDAQKIRAVTGIRVIGVVGNCDYMVKGPTEEMFAAGTRRVYLTHGHLYRVKHDMGLLAQRAKVLGADVVVFGHTHCPLVVQKDGMLFVNPGSPSRPVGTSEPRCAVLDFSRASVKARLLQVV